MNENISLPIDPYETTLPAKCILLPCILFKALFKLGDIYLPYLAECAVFPADIANLHNAVGVVGILSEWDDSVIIAAKLLAKYPRAEGITVKLLHHLAHGGTVCCFYHSGVDVLA